MAACLRPDSDVDGIPDAIDEYPEDPANHSHWWPGGTVFFNAHNYLLPARWFGGDGTDANEDSVPDCMEPTLWAIAGTAYDWPGGTFLLNGQFNTFDPWYLHECDCGDDDADGIPNVIDSMPNDPWNGTGFNWAGGEFLIDGGFITLGGGWFTGFAAIDTDADGIPDTNGDEDGDGIPDSLDPYPDEYLNNSTWWQGGTWWIDGWETTLNGQYYATTTPDSDGDDIPDSLDPYPADPANGCIWWPGGTFTIDAVGVSLPGLWISVADGDADGDGLPDSLDPYSSGPSNNSFYWPGGTFGGLIFLGGCYCGPWSDNDGDGIPNIVDPAQDRANNGPEEGTYWLGGKFLFENHWRISPEGFYPNTFGIDISDDLDGDNIPDFVDEYPDDPTNNSPDALWWDGGLFLIGPDANDTIYPGQWCLGENGALRDADYDRIPAGPDPDDTDPFNGTPGFIWPPFLNGAPTTVEYPMGRQNDPVPFESRIYLCEQVDYDHDGIPDVADPYPADYYNDTDTDWDGIPDAVEAAYLWALDLANPNDAETLRTINGLNEGLTWRAAYETGYLDSFIPNGPDDDSDGITNLYELANGLNPNEWTDGWDAPIGHFSAGHVAVMNDYILNVEKARGNWILANEVVDGADYATLTGHSPGEGITYHHYHLSIGENDWDDDGVSNVDEIVFGTDIRSAAGRPTDAQLIAAYLTTSLSWSTVIRFTGCAVDWM